MTRYEANIPEDAPVRVYGSDAYLYSQIGPWYWPIEAVAKGPQPEAHKSIHDYRDQLAAKKKRRKGKL